MSSPEQSTRPTSTLSWQDRAVVVTLVLGAVAALVSLGARILTLTPPEGQAAAPWLAGLPLLGALSATVLLVVGAGFRAARQPAARRRKSVMLAVSIAVVSVLGVVGAVASEPRFPFPSSREATLTTDDGRVVYLMRSGLLCSRELWTREGLLWMRRMESESLTCERQARLSVAPDSGRIEVHDEDGQPLPPPAEVGTAFTGWN